MATNGVKSGGVKPVDPADVDRLGMAAYRAPSLLQPHRAREALADAHNGKIRPLIGYFLGLSCPPIAQVVAQLGYDFVWIDWEHAATNTETMTQMVHDISFHSEGRSIPIVRVPGHGHASIGYALDAGASIVVPQVDTVEQAKEIVAAAKFGADIGGKRSAPPARWAPGFSDTCLDPSLTLHQNLNKQAAIVIQIESWEGINNLDAILTECGDHIDSVWLGSLDARISMGFADGGIAGSEKEWLDAVALFESVLTKHNKPASGLSFGPPEIKARLAKGRSFMVVAADLYAIIGNGATELAAAREAYPAKNYKDSYLV